MSMIESRIAKLEELIRGSETVIRIPGVPDETMINLRRVASVCNSSKEVAAYLASLLPAEQADVVSLDERRRTEAVISAAARTIFDESRLPTGDRAA